MIQNSIKENEIEYPNLTICSDCISTKVEVEEFEIGFKPKSKKFSTSLEKQKFIDEYTKKKKTELCKNFMLKGQCKFGSECSYAHGYLELLPKAHIYQNYGYYISFLLYKTKPCKNFITEGWCNYGSRCQYIHPENSQNTNQIHKLKSQDKQIQQQKMNTTNQNLTQQIIVLYSELLQKLNFSPQFSISSLPRLSYFKRLGKYKI